jgi:predicted AAA+ superfamily ATPase
MNYISRIVDAEMQKKLNASGAVVVRGVKACGKTETAVQFAKSILQVDRDEQAKLMLNVAPQRLLLGETPRLIDEWQEAPKLWDYVRHEVDKRKLKGQFILTGSATPRDNAKIHSGAGRFTLIDMRTMSWQEMGYSTGAVSLQNLLSDNNSEVIDDALDVEIIVERMIKGGWPALVNSTLEEAMLINRAYVALLAEVDMSRVSDVKRDPVKVRNILRSLARNTATLLENTTLMKDIKEIDNQDISRPTLIDYLDALERLMIIEDQPAWNTHLRSSAELRKSKKRHFSDVSLAISVLGADKQRLLDDIKTTGSLFESLAVHDLRVYAQHNDATVSHYRDSTGLEIDAIVEKYNGDWAAFEVKLGTGMIDDAAENLKAFAKNIDTDKKVPPKSLNIITGTGCSYRRADGINVISLASLGK